MKKLPWYNFPIALLLSVLSGVLLAFALPPGGLSILGWVAMLPLLVAARIERPVVGFLCGMIAALVCGKICGGHWDEAWQYGNLVAAFGSLALVFGLVTSLASSAFRRMSPVCWSFFVACVGVAGELAGHLVFPVSIALTQYRNPAALHLASITGIWGVTFLLWLTAAGLAAGCSRWKSALPALLTVTLVLLGACYMPFSANGARVTVAAIQAPDGYEAAGQTMLINGRAQIIVWPELLLGVKDPVPASCAKSAGAYLAIDVSEPNPNSQKRYNAVFLLSPSGQRIATFRKQHPFGKEKFTFAPGQPSDPANAGAFHIGAPICFDTQFTGVCRGLVRRGADILLVPNHDPEIPNSMFNYLHSAVIPFRAAENGVPVVWSECLGLSSIVDSDGRIVAQAPPRSVTSVVGTVHLRTGNTFYTRAGDYFACLCAAFAAAAFALSYKVRTRR